MPARAFDEPFEDEPLLDAPDLEPFEDADEDAAAEDDGLDGVDDDPADVDDEEPASDPDVAVLAVSAVAGADLPSPSPEPIFAGCLRLSVR